MSGKSGRSGRPWRPLPLPVAHEAQVQPAPVGRKPPLQTAHTLGGGGRPGRHVAPEKSVKEFNKEKQELPWANIKVRALVA